MEYRKDSLLLKLLLLANTDLQDDDKIPTRVDYSFDGPFQLLDAGVGNLEFLRKNATIPKYVLIYSSKVYICPTRSRKQILQKMNEITGGQ